MIQQIHIHTIGVSDFEAMKNFYTNVFKWQLMNDGNGIAFFKMKGGIFALYDEKELAEDIGIPFIPSTNKNQTRAILLSSEDEVDNLFNALIINGAKSIKSPQKAFWGGYSSYIADLEDNFWEIAFNPYINPNEL